MTNLSIYLQGFVESLPWRRIVRILNDNKKDNKVKKVLIELKITLNQFWEIIMRDKINFSYLPGVTKRTISDDSQTSISHVPNDGFSFFKMPKS